MAVYAVNHPIGYLANYVNARLFDGELASLAEPESVKIENDVWIGYGSIVLPGVSIGNGAIVGAGSIVTKDVGDYSVVAGNPAREIKKRFSSEIIQLLLDWRWWEKDPKDLAEYKSLFMIHYQKDPDAFLEALRGAVVKERELSQRTAN